MTKLLKKLTLITTTAFTLCITSTTTTTFPIIPIQTEDTTPSDNIEQDTTIGMETEPEIQPLSDKEHPENKKSPLS